MSTSGSPTATQRTRIRILQHRWFRFAVRRGGRLIVSLWVVVTAAFAMIHLIPGDPVRASLGMNVAPDVVAARREALGLNRPLWDQYVGFFRGLFTGDLGTSIMSRLPVWQTITARLPGTLSIAVPAFLIALLVAVPLGVGMAVLTRNGRHRRTELGFVGTSVVLGSIPDFLYGMAFIAIFGVALHWLPVALRGGPESYILPILSLAIGPIAVLARIVRVEVLAVLQTDYIRTARAKRLRRWRIYLRHALPNAVTATLTLSGMLLAGMIIGTVFVENVFAWPGLGQTVVTAITTKDFPVAQGVILMYGFGVIVINTVVDLILAVLDPRSTVSEA